MKDLKTLIVATLIAGGFLLTPPLSFADGQEGGLIGKRYAGGDLSLEHFHSVRFDDAEDFGALVNVPVYSNLDATFRYGLSHLMGPNYSRVQNDLSATVVTYAQDEYGKPFFSATLGQGWDTTKFNGSQISDNSTLWGFAAGIEVGFMGDSAITYSLGFSDGFKGSGRNPTWKCGLQLNHWFTPRIAGLASFTYNKINHAPDSLQYTVGMRFVF
jgi:hypothetical protein